MTSRSRSRHHFATFDDIILYGSRCIAYFVVDFKIMKTLVYVDCRSSLDQQFFFYSIHLIRRELWKNVINLELVSGLITANFYEVTTEINKNAHPLSIVEKICIKPDSLD